MLMWETSISCVPHVPWGPNPEPGYILYQESNLQSTHAQIILQPVGHTSQGNIITFFNTTRLFRITSFQLVKLRFTSTPDWIHSSFHHVKCLKVSTLNLRSTDPPKAWFKLCAKMHKLYKNNTLGHTHNCKTLESTSGPLTLQVTSFLCGLSCPVCVFDILQGRTYSLT